MKHVLFIDPDTTLEYKNFAGAKAKQDWLRAQGRHSVLVEMSTCFYLIHDSNVLGKSPRQVYSFDEVLRYMRQY